MKRSIYILLVTVVYAVAGCTDIDKANPYDDQLHTLQVTAVYPDEYAEYLREGVTVKIEDVDRGNSYRTKTDKKGTAQFSLTNGIYRIQVSDKNGTHIFNGLADNVKLVNSDMTFSLPEPEQSLSKKSIAEDAKSCHWKEITSPTNTSSCTTTIRKYSTSTACALEHSILIIHTLPMYG